MTNLSRWEHIRVDGDAVLLASVCENGRPNESIVVAQLHSCEEAQALLREINQRIALGARQFDVLREWPSPTRYDEGDDVEGEAREALLG